MQRRIDKLENTEFDLVVIGGGIFGACAVWEAVLRGLSVAIVEANDFCSGVSANSFKIVHGGIRYTQHLDVTRIRSSSRERSAFLRIAPHLVYPLPVMVPTYGLGMLGMPILSAGMLLYDLLTIGRNRGIEDNKRQIPISSIMGKKNVLKHFPELPATGLTGACVFHDGRFHNPTRLVLAFIQSAVSRGAIAANYLKAESLIIENGRVKGVNVHDLLDDRRIKIDSKVVLNTTGPWAENFDCKVFKKPVKKEESYSRDVCFVVKRRFPSKYTLAIQGITSDPDAVLSRPARHLFLSPWRSYTMIGVWHKVTKDFPEDITVSTEEIQEYIEEINHAFPELNISINDVLMWNAGLVPFGENDTGSVNLSYGKRSHLIDHEKRALDGYVTLIGVRYTMARGEAEKALDLVQKKLNQSIVNPGSDFIKIQGAAFHRFESLVNEIKLSAPFPLSDQVIESIAHSYGSDYHAIFKLMTDEPTLSTTLGGSDVLKASVIYAVRNEMVTTLSDVVFRRTDLATGGDPGTQALRECADLMAAELDWKAEKIEEEIQLVNEVFFSKAETDRNFNATTDSESEISENLSGTYNSSMGNI